MALTNWWKLDETSGTSFADSAGSNTGTSTNGPTPSTNVAPLLFANPRSLACVAASSQYVDCGAVSALNSATAITMCGWIYRASTGDTAAFGTRGSNTARFNLVWFSDGNIYFQNGNGNQTYGMVALTGTGWHHVCQVFNGSLSGNARLIAYVDGVLKTLSYNGTQPSALATNASAGNFNIGRETGVLNSNANFDDIRIYNSIESASTIAALAAGKDLKNYKGFFMM